MAIGEKGAVENFSQGSSWCSSIFKNVTNYKMVCTLFDFMKLLMYVKYFFSVHTTSQCRSYSSFNPHRMTWKSKSVQNQLKIIWELKQTSKIQAERRQGIMEIEMD